MKNVIWLVCCACLCVQNLDEVTRIGSSNFAQCFLTFFFLIGLCSNSWLYIFKSLSSNIEPIAFPLKFTYEFSSIACRGGVLLVWNVKLRVHCGAWGGV